MRIARCFWTRARTLHRLLTLLTVGFVIAGCGSAHVVRQPGSHLATRGPVRVSAPRYGATATVQRGETLYRIATGNGISALDLAMWNDIPPPYTIYPGQRLHLYPSQRVAGSRVHNIPAMRSPATPRRASPQTVAATPAIVPTSSTFSWLWPADGALAGRYAAGEPTQQGIDISGAAGQPIRAAADGVVVYSGSGLVGYGELIIVKHNDAWLSAYGHNRSRLVNEGQSVKAGQQIAEMGHSGVNRDMLHFEIRFNGKPVDPLEYLPRRD